MAKISANGAREVARIRVTSPTGSRYGHRAQWLLRSDGAVLRKHDIPGDGWTVIGKPKTVKNLNRAALIALAHKHGYEVAP